ncbi:MAG: PilZ domain-containing protein [Phycisphaerae bacterium]
MDSDTIPLEEGPASSRVLVPEAAADRRVRGNRSATRWQCDDVVVCFSPVYQSGRVDHAECPVSEISATGMAVVFDRSLERGLPGSVAYRILGGRHVRAQCRVRTCTKIGESRYLLGLQFTRRRRSADLKPLKHRAGRDIAPGARPRKLCAPEAVSI